MKNSRKTYAAAEIEPYKDRLSKKHYDVLIASAVHGSMTNVEIAGVLDIPDGTHKSRLNRARNALDALIEKSQP